MSGPTTDDVRAFFGAFLNRKLEDRGRRPLRDLPDDYDLLLSGALDSLAFVEMMMAAGEYFDGEIDFENLDPEQMTLIGPLCLFVSEQLTQPRWRNGATGSSPPFG
ncbi:MULTISPECIES: acyl carrier protein [unclassified Bradyrhizobium]|uniref:acyl carrier protein n=1 Tax=unclassified Bradyrhizobium TaxID=2631580 RepID=UPI001BA91E0C|nr:MULTISPECIES: acyl carrier protein [unclassified Bradyrhizobium]MBR1202038.1 acyl carrier protein [Bradyrhizobium sp. AUGA SZCCT0124]MBR1311393.1 acyl carrier protein [Bradyrhizobium sp. AUGA SZCCT0051]MBR1338987.1 acyl carrier protein [Bradyrhizobium sp. AUGA SZCCT0105]MBR1353561.1 acyl carrier protein [Bradyrhizobium sp. AUGA SZCCT0045]